MIVKKLIVKKRNVKKPNRCGHDVHLESARWCRSAFGLAAGVVALAAGAFPLSLQAQVTSATGPVSSDPKVREVLKRITPLIPLSSQPYALCAGAVTFNFDGITYARCQVMNGNSLAQRHPYKGGDAKTVNALGNNNNGFFLSTYSPPTVGEFAMYSCKGQGSFAQCNGGVCFTSTKGTSFPGLGKLASDQIVCSCPIKSEKDYSVWGPPTCPTTRAQYDSVCGAGTERATTKNGVSLHVGQFGPPAVMTAINLYYDRLFKTSSAFKTCERP